jgi:hypothetical protein
MALRQFSISNAKQGMTRLRNKGGASKDSFYTLRNCYVTSDRSVVPRPGSVLDTTLPAGVTKGLMMFRGKLYVFSSEYVEITNPKYRLIVLQHPDGNNTSDLLEIHFAQPFLGYPYVVASFVDDPDTAYHYWLEGEGEADVAWQADTTYELNEIVQPTVQTGYTYRATRLGPPGETWKAGVERDVGDVIEPTTQNGYEYVAIEAYGTPARSGTTEPDWPAKEGATVIEEADLSGTPTPTTTPPPTVPPGTTDRYGRYSGGTVINNRQQLQ